MKTVRYYTPKSLEEARTFDPARGSFIPSTEPGKRRGEGGKRRKPRRRS